MSEPAPTAQLGMEALVRLTNALVSLTNDNSALREENRQLRQALQENLIAREEEGEACCKGGACKGCQEPPAMDEEEGEEVDG